MPFHDGPGRLLAEVASISDVRHPLIEQGTQHATVRHVQRLWFRHSDPDLPCAVTRHTRCSGQVPADYRNHSRDVFFLVVIKRMLTADPVRITLARVG